MISTTKLNWWVCRISAINRYQLFFVVLCVLQKIHILRETGRVRSLYANLTRTIVLWCRIFFNFGRCNSTFSWWATRVAAIEDSKKPKFAEFFLMHRKTSRFPRKKPPTCRELEEIEVFMCEKQQTSSTHTYLLSWRRNTCILPGKLTCPLKVNGWKMYFLLK